MTEPYETQVASEALAELREFWILDGLTFAQATMLAFYQVTGGNAFALTDLDNELNLAPRPEA